MKLITDYILKDEPCYGLIEGAVPTVMGERWVQGVEVIRDDRVYHYYTDFGPASDFSRVQPLYIPSLGDDTVAQLQELAEKNRHDDYWAKRADEMLASSTLKEDHIRQRWEIYALMNNRSVFGPAVTVQRNGFSKRRN